MPNPLLSVRIPPALDELLPQGRGERSRVTIEALYAYLQPSQPEQEIPVEEADRGVGEADGGVVGGARAIGGIVAHVGYE